MNSGNPTEAGAGQGAGATFSLDDILYSIFRHKFLILAFVLLGGIGAAVVRVMKPPMYESQAKIAVRFVQDVIGTDTSDPDKMVRSTVSSVQSIMDTEVEIIRSFDTACVVATNFGPGKILAALGGGDDPMSAAGVVASGITVEPPRTATITVFFRHQDGSIVQPVLAELVKTYKRKHMAMRMGTGQDTLFEERLEDVRRKLATTEEELKRLTTEAGIVELNDSMRTGLEHINEIEKQLFTAELDLAQHKANIGDSGAASGATQNSLVPTEKLEDYSTLRGHLEAMKKLRRDHMLTMTEQHPTVQGIQRTIESLTRQKSELETEYPPLKTLYTVNSATGAPGTNSAGSDLAFELAEIKRLTHTVETLRILRSNKTAEAFRIKDLEPRIVELKRRREAQLKEHEAVLNALEGARSGAKASDLANIYEVQTPSPPGLDNKKLMKLMGGVFGGSAVAGLGIALLIDMFLVRTIRRSSDVKRSMHMPLFLTIPDVFWSNKKMLPSASKNGHSESKPVAVRDAASGGSDKKLAVAPWKPDHYLQSQIEGLRERVITHFEVNDLNRRPKLVGLTSCEPGAGVSTLAAGLAASLSRTGDGNVLLVDMETGNSYSFYKGAAGCGPSVEIHESEESDQQPADPKNMSLAKINPDDTRWERISKIIPESTNNVFPNLNLRDYDYIVFDMAVVSQTSVTPRMAGHMDLLLLILECEKTGQAAARQAASLMRESRANVVTVLNKFRNYVPAALSHE